MARRKARTDIRPGGGVFSFAKLTSRRRIQLQFVLAAVVFGLLFWLADAVLDYLFFYSGERSFLDILIIAPPEHEVYIRLFVFALLFVGALVLANDALRLAGEVELYHGVFRESPDAIFLVDPTDGSLIDFNERACEILGYERDVLAKLRIPDLDARESEAAIAQKLDDIEQHGHAQFETRLRTCDARVIDVEIRTHPLYHQGRPMHLAVVQDVTEPKTSQLIIGDLHQRMTLALETADIGIWQYDKTTNELVWDDSMFRLYGISPDDFGGVFEAWEQCVHPDDLERASAEARATLLAGAPFNTEFRIIRPDGEVRYIQANARVLEDGKGDPLGQIGTNYDVTERRRSELALQESEARYRDIAESLPGAVFRYLVEPDGSNSIEYMSPGCYGIWDISADEPWSDPAPPWAMILEEDAEAMTASVAASARDLSHWRHDWRIKTRSGRQKWLRGSGLPRRTASGGTLWNTIILDITAQQELHERIEKIAAHVPGTLYQYQQWPDGRTAFPYASRGIREIYGVDPAELVSDATAVFNALHPEDLPRVSASIDASFRRLTDWADTYRACLPDGRIIWVAGEASPERQADGSVLWHGYLRDVTRQKLGEQERKHLQDMLARTESVSHLGSWDWEVETDRVTWSDQMFRLFQVDPAEGAPSFARHAQFFAPDDMERLRQVVQAAVHDAIPYAIELAFIRRDGERRVCRAHGYPEVGPDQRVTMLFGSVQDITEQQEAEQALRESEERYRSLVEGSPDIVYSFSGKRGGLFWSARVEDVLGHPIAYLKVHPTLWFESIHPEDRGRVQEAILAFESGMPFDLEYRIQDRQGRWHWLRDRSIQRRVLGDEVIIDGLASDITERKRLEAELFKHQQHLEDLVERKTAELARARDQAEAANVAKSVFLANMSHEIRTPLNAVLGMTHLMRRDGVTPAQASRLDKIEVAGHHLLDVINTILDLSKIEAGKLNLESSEVRVDVIVRRLVSMLSDQFAAKSLKLLVKLERLPPDLYGDPVRIQQALMNYAANAVKFTDSGSITLRVLLAEDLGDSAVIRFEVEDTGIGIAPEQIAELFADFQQTDSSITRRYGGTGLGLSFTKRLAQLMGGDAGVDSVPGVGSTFWFTVRLQREASSTAETEIGPASTGHPVSIDACAGRRVLLVEDEPINREIVEDLIADLGLRVDAAADGREAVERVRNQSYDAILMDMQMPVMDGLAATRAIRHLSKSAQIPIIAMTANAFAEDRARCLEAGMNDFLSKPVDPERLLTVLRHWLTRAD